MKRTIVVTWLVLAMTAGAPAQRRGFGRYPGRYQVESLPRAKTEAEKRILGVVAEAAKAGEMFANVSVNDGRMLRLLTESAGAKHVVEIGTSTGISGLWFCLALQKTGGKLTTFEIDHGRAATAREHFKKAGMDRVVTVIEGDAHRNVSALKEPIDVLFIDADKDGYLDYLNKLLPLVRPGGLILAHDLRMADEYARRVTTNSDLETLFWGDGGDLGVTLKKR